MIPPPPPSSAHTKTKTDADLKLEEAKITLAGLRSSRRGAILEKLPKVASRLKGEVKKAALAVRDRQADALVARMRARPPDAQRAVIRKSLSRTQLALRDNDIVAGLGTGGYSPAVLFVASSKSLCGSRHPVDFINIPGLTGTPQLAELTRLARLAVDKPEVFASSTAHLLSSRSGSSSSSPRQSVREFLSHLAVNGDLQELLKSPNAVAASTFLLGCLDKYFPVRTPDSYANYVLSSGPHD